MKFTCITSLNQYKQMLYTTLTTFMSNKSDWIEKEVREGYGSIELR